MFSNVYNSVPNVWLDNDASNLQEFWGHGILKAGVLQFFTSFCNYTENFICKPKFILALLIGSLNKAPFVH